MRQVALGFQKCMLKLGDCTPGRLVSYKMPSQFSGNEARRGSVSSKIAEDFLAFVLTFIVISHA